nr:tyrosine-type recombinase/integrase [Novosphingobium acidiphilum]
MLGGAAVIDPALLDAAFRAWSENTRRAFRSDLMLWWRWCGRRSIEPGRATPTDVARWIRELADGEDGEGLGRAVATIERYLVHVGRAYRLVGVENPVSAELVRLEVKAMRNARGVRQRQAKPIRFKGEISDLDSPAQGLSLVALLKACRRDLLGRRDTALLRVAYDTGVRRSELVAIEVADIEGPDADGAGTLYIVRSKSDRAGEGAHAYLSPSTMTAIAAWREKADINRGPLFRRVRLHFDGSVDQIGAERLHANSVTKIFRRLASSAREKGLLGEMSDQQFERMLAGISSHSIRVGVAQDNFAAGESLPAIMQAYRWRDAKTVMRYGAKLAAKSGASARLAKRFSD